MTPSNQGKSNEERLAETRLRLLEAVIETLAECGYSGTSTTEIARRSGLTRGAQLHHFGTKDQMMVATVEHLATRTNAAEIAAMLERLPTEQERMRAALSILAELFNGPTPAAYVELWVASRTHRELADALRQTDVLARDNVRALFGEQLLQHSGPEFNALLDLTMYALRGMALDAHLADDEERQARKNLILGLANYLEAALQNVGA